MGADYTDQVLAEWQAVRPDFDASTAGVVNRILRLARLLESELDRVVARHGLSTKGDFDTLAALRRHTPEPELSPTHLAEAALITTGGMTGRLDRLEKSGYVERRSDPGDRRALLVRLTTLGSEVVDEVLEASLQPQRALLEPLGTGQRTELAQLLRLLLARLESE
ncbi:MAG TPA: MarR family transcriptional regulator [Acidimicrobiia bacterium]|jgi:DNA-binding MarR family transcriptional regulator|nr:MarR family transcriptional regulator [Acidimicrobiia bacterium]